MDLVGIAKEARDMRVLVAGSRDYDNDVAISERLDKVGKRRKVEIIQGEAPGADRAGKLWGQHNRRKVHSFPANWRRHGKAAGPIRNKQMLDEGKPDLVLAFTKDPVNSKGTRHMVRTAKKAGVPTVVYDADGKPIRRRDLPDQ